MVLNLPSCNFKVTALALVFSETCLWDCGKHSGNTAHWSNIGVTRSSDWMRWFPPKGCGRDWGLDTVFIHSNLSMGHRFKLLLLSPLILCPTSLFARWKLPKHHWANGCPVLLKCFILFYRMSFVFFPSWKKKSIWVGRRFARETLKLCHS